MKNTERARALRQALKQTIPIYERLALLHELNVCYQLILTENGLTAAQSTRSTST